MTRRPGLFACLLALPALLAGCYVPGDGGPGPETPPVRPDGAADGDAGESRDGGNASARRVRLALVADGLEAPVQLVDPADGSGRRFVVEQGGTVRILRDGRVDERPFLDLSGDVATGTEQGLLSVAFDPTNASRVYVSYTDARGDSVLARYRVDPADADRLDPSSAEAILKVEQPFGNHNGGLATFGPDGMLYFGLGDGGSANDPLGNGQDVDTLLGKILRLDVSGGGAYAIPSDNPFVGRDGRDEILHYGLRNPWRFSFDRQTGELYIADVGQNQVEEIDVVPSASRGVNFGWNAWEGSRRVGGGLRGESATFPVAEYTHDATGGCSVTGGHVYRGDDVPALVGKYLYADYCSGTVWTLERISATAWSTRILLDTDMRITSFAEDAAGELYVVDHRGSIHRFVAE